MIYLDNAATTFPKPEEVYKAMDMFYRTAGGNPGRSGHSLATKAEALIQETRKYVAKLINAKDPSEVVFTLNATDALNIAIKGTVREGDHVVTSNLEHNSVIRPLNQLQEVGLIEVTKAKNTSEFIIDPESVKTSLKKNTRLVIITWASNAIGTIQPVREIAKIVKEHGALLLLDGSQVAGAHPIDVSEIGCDMLAFPGHKGVMGPTGTGVLWVKKGVDCRPLREGGTGGDSTKPFQPEEMPYRLEAGTPNTLGISGLLAGVKWILEKTPDNIRMHEASLTLALMERLSELNKIRIVGPCDANKRMGIVSFLVEGYSVHEVCAILDQRYDIAVRSGLHCAPEAHKAAGTFPDGTVRASFGPFSSMQDIEILISALIEITRY